MADDIVTRIREEAKKQTTLGQAFDLLHVADEIERLRAERDEARAEASIKGYRLDDALDEIERLRAVVDALTARPFRGTSSERRDRMYGSDWEPVHDALDALEARRG